MNLITEMSKVPRVHWLLTPVAQILLSFALRLLVFQIIEVFAFPIGYNGEIEKIVKNWKLKISKIQKSTFVRTIDQKIRENDEKVQSDLRYE